MVGSQLDTGTVSGGRIDVTQGRGSAQPAPVDFLLRPAHLSVACLALFLPCSCSCICCFMGSCTYPCSGTGCGCFLPFFGAVFAAVAAVLVLVYLLLHGRLNVLVLEHLRQVFLCLCLGWFLRLLLPCSCSCIRCFVGTCTCSCSGPAAGVSLPLFEVVFAAVAAVLVLVYLLLHGRLHVLVLGHLLRVFLCLCLGWFLRLLLPCSCSCIPCFVGGCTCSCLGTGRLCFFAI